MPGQDTNYAGSMPATGCAVNSVKVKAASYGPTPSVQRTISANTPLLGNFKGLSAWVTTYAITASATDTSTSATSVVSLNVMKYLVPIFQFGIFYNNLEMNPGANLNIPVNGWIHTNKNLYTSTSASETINSHITSAGQIDHTRAPNDTNAVGTGTVQIMGADGQLHSLSTGWSSATNGVTTWGGNVSNQVTALNLPLPQAASDSNSEYQGPEYILSNSKSLSGTMDSQAAVTITTASGNSITVTDTKNNTLNTCYYNGSYKSGSSLKVDTGCSSGANKQSVTTSSIYDYRQKTTVQTTDIDVAGFQASDGGQGNRLSRGFHAVEWSGAVGRLRASRLGAVPPVAPCLAARWGLARERGVDR